MLRSLSNLRVVTLSCHKKSRPHLTVVDAVTAWAEARQRIAFLMVTGLYLTQEPDCVFHHEKLTFCLTLLGVIYANVAPLVGSSCVCLQLFVLLSVIIDSFHKSSIFQISESLSCVFLCNHFQMVLTKSSYYRFK